MTNTITLNTTNSHSPIEHILRRQTQVLQFQLARLCESVKRGDEKLIDDEVENSEQILELSRPSADERGRCFQCDAQIKENGTCQCTEGF